MRTVLVIAAKDLRQRLRDRSALVLGLLAPLGVAALMSLAFGATTDFHLTMGVVDADRGPVAAGIVDALRGPGLRGIVSVRPLASGPAARAAVRQGRVDAALVIPSGFSASVEGAHPDALTTVTNVDDTVAGDITAAVAASFVAQLNADRLSVATALAAGAPAARRAGLEALAAGLRIPESARPARLGPASSGSSATTPRGWPSSSSSSP
ncbi:MAG TPA: ABC transporter permease [Acidimicrobiales bacterium]|nr:ABC transporter permease [Acidimicrobiales bacterium]